MVVYNPTVADFIGTFSCLLSISMTSVTARGCRNVGRRPFLGWRGFCVCAVDRNGIEWRTNHFPLLHSPAGNVVAGTKVMKQCRPSTIHGKFSAAQETSPISAFFFQLPNLRIARLEKMTLPEINGKNWRGILCDVRVPLACW